MSGGTLLPIGEYGFPLAVSFTQVLTPTPGQPLPPTYSAELVGPPPGGPFNEVSGARHSLVGWNGSNWNFEYHDAFYGEPSVPLIWDAGSLTWKASLMGPTAYLRRWWRMDVAWTPECDFACEWLRTDLDVRQGNPLGDVWRMEDALVYLADGGPASCVDPPPLWIGGHPRGLCYPSGSQAGARVDPQSTRFLAP